MENTDRTQDGVEETRDQVLSLQQTPAAEAENDVQAHISTTSLAICDIKAEG